MKLRICSLLRVSSLKRLKLGAENAHNGYRGFIGSRESLVYSTATVMAKCLATPTHRLWETRSGGVQSTCVSPNVKETGRDKSQTVPVPCPRRTLQKKGFEASIF